LLLPVCVLFRMRISGMPVKRFMSKRRKHI
jgi:hypothetical protein